MARGWESKSVESQQFEAPSGDQRQAQFDPAAQRREGLELSRRRIVRELETSKSPVHRTALENALKHLDDELARL